MKVEEGLCRSIESHFPGAAACDKDLAVRLETGDDRFRVSLGAGDDVRHEWLTVEDATACLEDGRCTAMALRVLGLLAEHEASARRRPPPPPLPAPGAAAAAKIDGA